MKRYPILLLSFCLLIMGSINAQNSKKKTGSKNMPRTVELTTEQQRKFDYYFYEALNAKSVGKYDAAFDYFNYCFEIDSTNANIRFQLGDFYQSTEKQSKAFESFRKAVELDPENDYYRIAYAGMCLELKQYTEAIEQYETLLKKDPNNTELYLYLSESNRLEGNLPKAIEALDKLEQSIGLNEKISLQKFQLYSLMKQENKAFSEIQKYIEKYPSVIKYQVLLGNLYMRAGKTKEAFVTYSYVKAIDPEDPYLISSMAAYYEATNNKAAAEDELKTALVSHKVDVDAKLGILSQYVSTLQENKQEITAVNALFDTLMLLHPQESKLNLMYGDLLMMESKKDDARFQYQLFAESNPTNPRGWEQMLSTVFPDSLDISIDICKQAISFIPESPQFYFYQGLSEYIKKDYNNALQTLLTGSHYVEPTNARLLSDYYGQIGDLYHQTNKKDSSFVYYEKALEMNPENIGILNNYSYHLSIEKKDLSRAEKMSGITIKKEPTNPTYLDTYGWVLFVQGAYTMAKIYIEKAVEYSLEKEKKISAEVLEHYGDVLFKTNEPEKALEYWIKAKETGDSESKTLDHKIETKTYIEK